MYDLILFKVLMKFQRLLFMALTLLMVNICWSADLTQATSREPATNAAPLGLEIGYANIGGVKAKIGKSTDLVDKGINAYTYGPMLSSNGAGLDIDGLSEITFIFNKDGVLEGVLMTMPKKAVEMHGSLSKKYKVVTNNIDTFMGNGYAKYSKGDSIVELNAPHMSFKMNINYLSKKLMADFLRESQAEATSKKKNQESKL